MIKVKAIEYIRKDVDVEVERTIVEVLQYKTISKYINVNGDGFPLYFSFA